MLGSAERCCAHHTEHTLGCSTLEGLSTLSCGELLLVEELLLHEHLLLKHHLLHEVLLLLWSELWHSCGESGEGSAERGDTTCEPCLRHLLLLGDHLGLGLLLNGLSCHSKVLHLLLNNHSLLPLWCLDLLSHWLLLNRAGFFGWHGHSLSQELLCLLILFGLLLLLGGLLNRGCFKLIFLGSGGLGSLRGGLLLLVDKLLTFLFGFLGLADFLFPLFLGLLLVVLESLSRAFLNSLLRGG